MNKAIILASSSPFRRSILEKLQLPFEHFSPDINETAKSNEAPSELVERLSIEKAKVASQHFDKGLAIGSDQVAVFEGQILGKPHNRENAFKQLQQFSGQTVTFLTGLALHDIESEQSISKVVPFKVHFRKLTTAQIYAYLDAEEPYQCAGSFKSEGLGICLFERLEGEDPNTLIGLPLIELTKMLGQFNLDVLAQQNML